MGSIEHDKQSPTPSTEEHKFSDSDSIDQALVYVQNHGGEHGAVNESRLVRKIDWRIVPVMFLCYTMQFIDKVNINYAAVMGLNKDLKLVGNDFTWAATGFFIAYLIFEIPTGYILQKVPVGKYLGVNVILWGIATACTAAAKDFKTLLLCRIFLGIFEASIAPSLTIITGMWYTKKEQPPRFALWYCGLGLGQILGGAVSFGFQHVTSKSFNGWKTMFVVLGAVTILIGALTFFMIPDSPMTAGFLDEDEKVFAIERLKSNQTGIINKHFKISHVLELLTDPQMLIMILMTACISVSSGVVTTYSATLIRNFGFTPKRTALLNMPSGAVSILATLLSGFAIKYTSNRWAWLVACTIPGITGGALMSYLPSKNRAGLLAGIYMINSIVATLIIIYNWISANIAGQTKRTAAAALISAAFSIGNIIGPQTFQARDAPQYKPAKIAVLATQAAGACLAVLLMVYYRWKNAQKNRIEQEARARGEVVDGANHEWMNYTDKENKTFRYVL